MLEATTPDVCDVMSGHKTIFLTRHQDIFLTALMATKNCVSDVTSGHFPAAHLISFYNLKIIKEKPTTCIFLGFIATTMVPKNCTVCPFTMTSDNKNVRDIKTSKQPILTRERLKPEEKTLFHTRASPHNRNKRN